MITYAITALFIGTIVSLVSIFFVIGTLVDTQEKIKTILRTIDNLIKAGWNDLELYNRLSKRVETLEAKLKTVEDARTSDWIHRN